jgi:hypothetical protein
MRKIFTAIFVVFSLLLLINCSGGNGNGDENGGESLTPTLSSISPSSKASNLPSFTLKAIGSKFVNASQIVFNGVAKNTTYVNAAELTCQIKNDEISESANSFYTGSNPVPPAGKSVNVLVRNPASQGGESNSLNFSILSNPKFNDPVNISDNSGKSYEPVIAVDTGNNLNVVWNDFTSINHEIYFSRSADGGSSWSKNDNISSNAGTSRSPAIAVDNAGNINVVWKDFTTGDPEVYFSRSKDEGTSWSTPLNISKTGYADNPAIGTDNSDYIYVVWEEFVLPHYEIYFSRSTDGGSTWSNPVSISNSTNSSGDPDIAVDSTGKLYVVWEKYISYNHEIYFIKSNDKGVNWGQVVNLSKNKYGSLDPSIAVYNSNVYVVWEDRSSGDEEIYFKRSSNGGANWKQSIILSDKAYYDSYDPAISVDPVGNINVVWAEHNYDILYSRSVDNGASWSSKVNISNTAWKSYYPKIAVDSAGNINAVWREEYSSTNYEIFFIGSTR